MFNSDELAQLSDKYEFLAFAVKDNKSRTYTVPSFWRTPADALRNFESGCIAQRIEKQGVIFTHPDDFDFCCIGGFDASSGVLTSFEVPLLVTNAAVVIGSPDDLF